MTHASRRGDTYKESVALLLYRHQMASFIILALFALVLSTTAEAFSFGPIIQPHTKNIRNNVSLHHKTYRNQKHTTNLALSTTVESDTNTAQHSLGVTRGDTKGANLLLTDLYISTGGGNQILKSINFRVDPKERWGIVGPNGVSRELSLLLLVHLDDINFTHRFPYSVENQHYWVQLRDLLE